MNNKQVPLVLYSEINSEARDAFVGNMARTAEVIGQLEVDEWSQYIEWTQSGSPWISTGSCGAEQWPSGILYCGSSWSPASHVPGDWGRPVSSSRTVPLFITLGTGFNLYHPVIPKDRIAWKYSKFWTLSQQHCGPDVAPTTNLHNKQAFTQTHAHKANSTSLEFRKRLRISKKPFSPSRPPSSVLNYLSTKVNLKNRNVSDKCEEEYSELPVDVNYSSSHLGNGILSSEYNRFSNKRNFSLAYCYVIHINLQ